MFTVMLTAVTDLQITMEDTVAEEDKVVVRWTLKQKFLPSEVSARRNCL
jgi:hypothetical protein